MFTDPSRNLEGLGLHEGMVVADLGAGSGFYTLEAAKQVAGGGKVYAVDIQQDLLVRLKNAAHLARLSNVEVIHGDIENLGGTHIREGLIDVAIVSNVLFQIEKRDGFMTELKRIVKPGGRVLLIDWSESFGGMGPQPEHVMTEQKARELFTQHSFTEINTLSAGEHHYGIIFRKT